MKRKTPRRPHTPTIPRVVPKRLRKYHAWADNVKHEIEIDATLTGRAKLEALCHEWLHLHSWALPEQHVREISRKLVGFLHKNGARLIEPGNSPLDLDRS